MASIKAFQKRPNDGVTNPVLAGWLDLIWQLIKSDVYTPTLTNVTNLDASTAYVSHYVRIGDCVIVAGRVDMNPTAAAATELGVSLPIPSNFVGGGDNQCGGTFQSRSTADGGGIASDATNNRASFQFVATNTANRGYWFIFMYRIV